MSNLQAVTRRLHYKAHYKLFVNILFRNKSLYYRLDVGLLHGVIVQMIDRGKKEVSSHIINPPTRVAAAAMDCRLPGNLASRQVQDTRYTYYRKRNIDSKYITYTCNSFRLPWWETYCAYKLILTFIITEIILPEGANLSCMYHLQVGTRGIN